MKKKRAQHVAFRVWLRLLLRIRDRDKQSEKRDRKEEREQDEREEGFSRDDSSSALIFELIFDRITYPVVSFDGFSRHIFSVSISRLLCKRIESSI